MAGRESDQRFRTFFYLGGRLEVAETSEEGHWVLLGRLMEASGRADDWSFAESDDAVAGFLSGDPPELTAAVLWSAPAGVGLEGARTALCDWVEKEGLVLGFDGSWTHEVQEAGGAPDPAHDPSEGEALAAAETLGTTPEKMMAVRLPGPGRLGEDVATVFGGFPELPGFGAPSPGELAWEEAGRGAVRRPSMRYGSPRASLVVVSHEHGPVMFFLHEMGDAAALIRAILLLLEFLRERRREARAPDDVVNADSIDYEFCPDGSIENKRDPRERGPGATESR